MFRLATWDEIDAAGRLWTISAARMKAKREHRVSLCRRALEILDAARKLGEGKPLAFSMRSGPTSMSTLPKMLQYHRIAGVVHGFRSSSGTGRPRRLTTPRGHRGGAGPRGPEQGRSCYARSDLFERRPRLMDDWEGYLAGAWQAVDSST